MWYAFLDIFFLVFHTAILLFNLFGWIWPATRKAHLLLLLLTAASWFGLGYWYGWGYCVCTDWHWQVLEKRGAQQLPASYITYLLQRFFHLSFPEKVIYYGTAAAFTAAVCLSVATNFLDWRKRLRP